MGSDFDIVGTFKLSSTGCSIAVDLEDRLDKIYLGLKDLEKVMSKKKLNGTCYVLKPEAEPMPAYKPQ